MRRTSRAAYLAVPLLLTIGVTSAPANPPVAAQFGCGGHCFKLFPHLHQHGPLFNYGPYYGYYPFAPYGPWDAYLRYDPSLDTGYGGGGGGAYGWNPYIFKGKLANVGGGLGGLGCNSCGFWHASWLHGGWFRGHAWLHGGFGCKGHGCKGHGCQKDCDPCGPATPAAPATPAMPAPTKKAALTDDAADPLARYTGIGSPAQSAVYYGNVPSLNPLVELTAGQAK